MNTSMVTQDAQTFVALGRAMALARIEGTLDEVDAADLNAALVAGILTGCMEFETYARVHDAMARVLEAAFAGPVRPVPARPPDAGDEPPAPPEEPLGVYLEVVGEAWEKVSWDENACGRLETFVRGSFALEESRFGEGGWFRAPLRTAAPDLLRAAKAAGLLVASIEGHMPETGGEASLVDPDSALSGDARVVLGWGDRRTALDLRRGK